ncbi:MAG TPA: hypothetical protein VIM12_02925 [Noviherbaspirillum sp.]|jgi:hypothetical protein|uniref:hypothetical protein n=1 Tax=Noviherbaspirillum sp. TaxID=1926288 RepID=UPI002F94E59D
MNQWGYKSMMYAGALLGAFGVAAVAADVGTTGAIVFCVGFLVLLAGVVGYLWNGE